MPQSTCFVFDLDDRLYAERDYVRSGFAAAELLAIARLGIQGFADACWQSFLEGSRGRIFDEVLQSRFGIVDTEVVRDLVGVYRLHQPRIELYADARRILDRVGGLGLPMALITDGPSTSQRAKIEALALNAALSPLVVTAELGAGRSKPHPAAFERVQSALGRDKQFIYIADNPLKDFLAPNQLGWKSLRIQRASGLYSKAIEPTPAHAPQHVVGSLDDVWQFAK